MPVARTVALKSAANPDFPLNPIPTSASVSFVKIINFVETVYSWN